MTTSRRSAAWFGASGRAARGRQRARPGRAAPARRPRHRADLRRPDVGTAYGAVVLHVAPEAAAGGPLALVRTGDWISLDVPARALTLEVPGGELARRREGWAPPPPPAARGWTWLSAEHGQGADADLDFLTGASGAGAGRDSP